MEALSLILDVVGSEASLPFVMSQRPHFWKSIHSVHILLVHAVEVIQVFYTCGDLMILLCEKKIIIFFNCRTFSFVRPSLWFIIDSFYIAFFLFLLIFLLLFSCFYLQQLTAENCLWRSSIKIHFSFFHFFPTGCQWRDWIFVIRSDYRASADALCPPRGWINGLISLTDSLCVPRRQIGQLVPRWQLYRYGGDWRGAQGCPADSPWYLLEVPGLHWSPHVPEV